MRRPPSWHEFSRFPVTAGTIVLAVIATGLYWSGQDVSALVDGPGVRQWQLWRLLTSVLLHANVLHLLFNIYWVWTFGTLVEDVYGHERTLAFFVIVALGSSAAEFLFLSGGIGLSGVGYGLFGLLWTLSAATRNPKFENAVDRNTVNLFVIWFFACIFLTITKIMPIANIAHGVGAILGILIGRAINAEGIRRRLWSASAAAIVIGTVFGAVMSRSYVNFSRDGNIEARLAYDALIANKDEQAIAWSRAAIRIEPTNSYAWDYLGIAYMQRKELKNAADAFARAHELDPKQF
jgi:membrane associated rhomboid family serine protease